MGSDLAATWSSRPRSLPFWLRMSAALGVALSVSGCISIKPFSQRANYPVSRESTVAPDRPTFGDQALGKYKIGNPYKVDGVWYVPADQPDYDDVGMASWYGGDFHNKLTANGEMFDMNSFSAAHKTLPMPSIVEVTNLDNGKTMRLRVNDRGPFVGERIIDVSRAAAVSLGFNQQGLAKVRVRYVGPAKLLGPTDVASGNTASPSSQYYATSSEYQPSPDTMAEQDIAPIPVNLPPPQPAPTYGAPSQGISSAPLPPLQNGTYVSENDYSVQAQAPEYSVQSMQPEFLPQAPPQPQPQPQPQQQSYMPPASGPYQVVVGAFANQASAQNLAEQLGGMGQASLVPVDRGGQTLYRVVINGLADESQARMVQDRAISMGLTDARMARP